MGQNGGGDAPKLNNNVDLSQLNGINPVVDEDSAVRSGRAVSSNAKKQGMIPKFPNNSRRTTFAMAMKSNPHSLNDPAIQEALSPFFQPFGVDVSHLPMTNPPIFQSSSVMYDDPGRRRRISISNGQISQLGEDLETVENLYNSQPPPMPQKYDHNHQMIHYQQQYNQQKPIHNQNLVSTYNTNRYAVSERNADIQVPVPPPNYSAIPFNANDQFQEHMGMRTASLPAEMSQAQNVKMNIPSSWMPSDHVAEEMNKSSSNSNSSSMTTGNRDVKVEYEDDDLKENGLSQNILRSSSIAATYTKYPPMSQDIQDISSPGTTAWKRARLLERNRIAASKCRQRKKVAQVQLQRDFDEISEENKIIKKKLDYYEKLVSKFKKFSEAHLTKCNTDRESLKIIEEMLMIDSGIHEVDDSGLIVAMKEK